MDAQPETGTSFSKTMLATGVLLAVLFGVGATLFIPSLRYTTLVPPMIHDVDPKDIASDIQAHPERYLFIDVRSPLDYEKLHAEGSSNIPIHFFYDKWKEEFPRSGKTIVLVCSGGRLSGVAFSFLEHHGFRNIVRIKGGIENWQSEGFPVVLGDVLPPSPQAS